MYEDTAITLGHDDAVTLARLLWDLDERLATARCAVFEDLVAYFEPQAEHGIWPTRRRAEAARASLGRYWQRGRGRDQPAERIGEHLHVHPVPLVLPGVVRAVGGDTADRQQRAVQDHVRLRAGIRMRFSRVASR